MFIRKTAIFGISAFFTIFGFILLSCTNQLIVAVTTSTGTTTGTGTGSSTTTGSGTGTGGPMTVAPVVTGPVITNSSTAAFSWYHEDSATWYRTSVSGTAWDETGDTSLVLSPGEGAFTLFVQAWYEEGIWSDSGTCYTIVDRTEPSGTAALMSPASGYYTRNNLRPDFAWATCTDSATSVRYRLQLSSDSGFATPFMDVTAENTNWSPLQDLPGAYTMVYFRVRAEDWAGNHGSWSSSRSIHNHQWECDVNGDGMSDILAGSPLHDPASSDEGAAFLFYGQAGSVTRYAWNADAHIYGNTSSIQMGDSIAMGDYMSDGSARCLAVGAFGTSNGRVLLYENPTGTQYENSFDKEIVGDTDGDKFGQCIAMGDVNGDGMDDLVVGASREGADTSGAVYVFYGGGSVSGSYTASAHADVIIDATDMGFQFGTSLACADINNDGYMDIIVGSQYWDDGSNNDCGAVCVYFGSASLPHMINAWDTNRYILGDAAGDELGNAVACGDFNHDGYADIAAGAHIAYETSKRVGKVYILYGSNDASVTVYAGSTDACIMGTDTYDRFGWSVAAGDLTGDGVDDLVIGGFLRDDLHTNTGSAYVYTGGSLTGDMIPANAVFSVHGNNGNDYFGKAVSVLDITGDGQAELLVGAEKSGSGVGAVYGFHGPVGTGTAAAADADVLLYGWNNGDDFGVRLATGN